jgi:hypothetical protein
MNPIRYTFPACCASAVSGAARRLPAVAQRNVRRFVAGVSVWPLI